MEEKLRRCWLIWPEKTENGNGEYLESPSEWGAFVSPGRRWNFRSGSARGASESASAGRAFEFLDPPEKGRKWSGEHLNGRSAGMDSQRQNKKSSL